MSDVKTKDAFDALSEILNDVLTYANDIGDVHLSTMHQDALERLCVARNASATVAKNRDDLLDQIERLTCAANRQVETDLAFLREMKKYFDQNDVKRDYSTWVMLGEMIGHWILEIKEVGK